MIYAHEIACRSDSLQAMNGYIVVRNLLFAITSFVALGLNAQQNAFRVKDMMPEYRKLVQQAAHGEPDTKRFQQLLTDFDASFYREVVGIDLADTARLKEHLKSMAGLSRKLEYVMRHFKDHFQESIDRVATFYPEIRKQQHTVYIAPTFKRTNGQYRYWRGKWMLYFGPDAQAAYPGYKDLNALIIHELIHLLHSKSNDSISELIGRFYEDPFNVKLPFYYHLYVEGLTVYLTMQLDKRISLQAALMQPALNTKVDPELKTHLKKISELLASASLQDVQNYFWLNGNDPNVPHKTGYYIGYLLVKNMAKRIPRRKLLKLWGPELEKELRVSLGQLVK